MLEYSRVENSVGRLQTKGKFQLPSSNSIITIVKWVYIRMQNCPDISGYESNYIYGKQYSFTNAVNHVEVRYAEATLQVVWSCV